MKQMVTLTVNGERQHALAEPRHTLLELLRDGLGLTGTKEGCGDGNCGACTVLLDGRPVNSCLVLAVEAQGREVVSSQELGFQLDVTPALLYNKSEFFLTDRWHEEGQG
jgi:carbon-monoxide dehydrogenase small subunit